MDFEKETNGLPALDVMTGVMTSHGEVVVITWMHHETLCMAEAPTLSEALARVRFLEQEFAEQEKESG